MKNCTFTKNGFTFERISKRAAKTAYNNGLTVLMLSNYANPLVWTAYNANIKDDTDIGISEMFTKENSFSRAVNAFEFYNCNSQMGKYTAFYIPVCDVDRFTGEKPTPETIGTVKSYDYRYMGE